MKTLKTVLHRYQFDVSNPKDAAEYAELCAKLRSEHYHFFNVFVSSENDRKNNCLEDGPIELETEILFSDQWNTATHRVFDWYEPIYHNRNFKQGYYLEMTEAMRELRRTTLVCKYCGRMYPANGESVPPAFSANGTLFCVACLGSPYLEVTDLPLLRLRPVAIQNPRFEPLTDAEREVIMPAYTTAQTTGTRSRAVEARKKLRADVEEKHRKALENANNEHDGMLWLLDRDINTENCIYYTHTQTFSFGWRNSLASNVREKLLTLLEGFPFKFEIR